MEGGLKKSRRDRRGRKKRKKRRDGGNEGAEWGVLSGEDQLRSDGREEQREGAGLRWWEVGWCFVYKRWWWECIER